MTNQYKSLPGDWPEDFHLGNGNYWNNCIYCRKMFSGLKSRIICKLCSEERKEKATSTVEYYDVDYFWKGEYSD